MVKFKPDLRCFDPSQYHVTWSIVDRQCIAPRMDGGRCSWDIHPDELEEVLGLMHELAEASGLQKAVLCQRIVLLRTCGDQHREKLEAHTVCLQTLAKKYLRCLPERLGQQSLATPPLTPPRQTGFDSRASRGVCDKYGRPRRHYGLRPRQTNHSTEEVNDRLAEVSKEVFVPYQCSGLDQTVRQLLFLDVPSDYRRSGFVYAFKWPSHPDYLKIGYTASSVSDRVRYWQKCHSGAQLVHCVEIDFPKRFEELIHAELSAHRHKIIICPYCSSTHFEWFKVMETDLIAIMNSWQKLQQGGALYTLARQLAKCWREMLGHSDEPSVLSSWKLSKITQSNSAAATYSLPGPNMHALLNKYDPAAKHTVLVDQAETVQLEKPTLSGHIGFVNIRDNLQRSHKIGSSTSLVPSGNEEPISKAAGVNIKKTCIYETISPAVLLASSLEDVSEQNGPTTCRSELDDKDPWETMLAALTAFMSMTSM